MARVMIKDDPFVDFGPYKNGRQLGWDALTLGTWPAYWVDLPGRRQDEPTVVLFRLRFRAAKAGKVRFHVSGDNRYRLFLDGKQVGRGPERGDSLHWRYETYEVKLSAGAHTLVAQNWHLGQLAPFAQMTVRPGFILAAEGKWHERLSTGVAPWQAVEVEGREFRRDGVVWGTGAREKLSGRDLPWGFERGATKGYVPVEKIVEGLSARHKNEIPPYWLLTPATLPAMREKALRIGKVRHLAPVALDAASPVIPENHLREEALAWNKCLRGAGGVTIAPNCARTAVIDLGNYYCAYPALSISGGRDSHVRLSWAESLYTTADGPAKGNRNDVDGKYFRGTFDDFLPDGGRQRDFETLWWRAGRYLALTVETADKPLVLNSLTLLSTGYPYKFESHFEASDRRFERVTPIALRAIEMCSHETYMDCPYYEQLMYVGDTRLEVLTTYATTRDDRLPRKAIEVFDESRRLTGLTQSRYPSRVTQFIPPFSLWWVAMVHDYLMWRDDMEFVRARLAGVRTVCEYFRTIMRDDGLMGAPKGWNFMDWVDKPEWDAGVPLDGDLRTSSILNLQYALVLTKKAEIEEAFGERALATRDRGLAGSIVKAVLRAFLDDDRGLIADDEARTRFSEHAQCLAILTGLVPKSLLRRLARGLMNGLDLARTTIYFTHYLFEACYRLGRADRFMERLGVWFDLESRGFKTTFEMPEPSRSDCHAWGAHPVFHYYATLMGIRPAAPGFASVRIAPMLPESVEDAACTLVHPEGDISVSLRRKGAGLKGEVALPRGVDGIFVWNGVEKRLRGGSNRIG